MDDISALLKQMELSGEYAFEAVIANPTIIDRESGASTYIHAEGGKDEWRLRWVPFF